MYSIDEEMQFLNKYFMLISISNDFFAGLDNSGFQMLQKIPSIFIVPAV